MATPANPRKLPAIDLNALLGELETLQTRVRNGETLSVPQITVFLQGQHRVRGEFLRYGAFRGGEETLLLRETQSSSNLDVAYFPKSAILGILVHFSPENVALLSKGGIKTLPARIPSRLELERATSRIVETVQKNFDKKIPVEIAWPDFPLSDMTLAEIGRVLESLEKMFPEVGKEHLRKGSFKAKVEKISIGASPRVFGWQLDVSTLRLNARRDGEEIDFPALDELKSGLDGVL